MSISIKQRVLKLIAAKPNLTEIEIAARLFGDEGYQQRVNPICRELVDQGLVERLGAGRAGDPFKYRCRGAVT